MIICLLIKERENHKLSTLFAETAAIVCGCVLDSVTQQTSGDRARATRLNIYICNCICIFLLLGFARAPEKFAVPEQIQERK